MAEPKKKSWLIAAWPGLGSVGLGAASYLISSLKAHPVAEYPSTLSLESPGISVEKGLLLPVEAPKTFFHRWTNPNGPDLCILTADSQPAFRVFSYGHGLLDRLPDDIERVVTFAAAPRPMKPGDKPKVWAAASGPDLLAELEELEVGLLDQGQISGMNGLFPGLAALQGIEALCLLGELPYETVGIPNPKSSAAVLRVFGRMVPVELDLEPLDEMARDWEDRLISSMEKGDFEGDYNLDFMEELNESSDVPADVIANIERLFAEASVRRERAIDLKSELDRWKLFHKYEDRFLDLFKPDDP